MMRKWILDELADDVGLAEHGNEHCVARQVAVVQLSDLAPADALDDVVARAAHGDDELEARAGEEDEARRCDDADDDLHGPEHGQHDEAYGGEGAAHLLPAAEGHAGRHRGVLAPQLVRGLLGDLGAEQPQARVLDARTRSTR